MSYGTRKAIGGMLRREQRTAEWSAVWSTCSPVAAASPADASSAGAVSSASIPSGDQLRGGSRDSGDRSVERARIEARVRRVIAPARRLLALHHGVQFGGGGWSIRSGAPTGTINVTIVTAGAEELSTASCTALAVRRSPGPH